MRERHQRDYDYCPESHLCRMPFLSVTASLSPTISQNRLSRHSRPEKTWRNRQNCQPKESKPTRKYIGRNFVYRDFK
jgi:hypothetical protein